MCAISIVIHVTRWINKLIIIRIYAQSLLNLKQITWQICHYPFNLPHNESILTLFKSRQLFTISKFRIYVNNVCDVSNLAFCDIQTQIYYKHKHIILGHSENEPDNNVQLIYFIYLNYIFEILINTDFKIWVKYNHTT